MIIIGIDPGFSGAIAVIPDNAPAQIYSMPIITETKRRTRKPKKPLKRRRRLTKRRLDLDFLITRLSLYLNRDVRVFIEKSQPMPSQGTAGIGNYMKSYGQIIGILHTLGLPYNEVSPVVWKKSLGIPKGSDKSASIAMANQLFPYIDIPSSKDGYADAILIAQYGKLFTMGKR